MAMDYIRRQYRVPAKRGRRVCYKNKPGVIVGSHDALLRIKLDGDKRSGVYHPTWQIEYLPVEK